MVPDEMADLRTYALESEKKFKEASKKLVQNSLRASQGHDNLAENGYYMK